MNKFITMLTGIFATLFGILAVFLLGKKTGKSAAIQEALEQEMANIVKVKTQNDQIDKMDNDEVKKQMKEHGFIKN